MKAFMECSFGFSRETHINKIIELVCPAIGAGQMVCQECGGDGDWKKFHPEPELFPNGLDCVDCKGTGKVWGSI